MRKEKALTLVEVSVAIFVFAVGLIAIARLFPVTSKTTMASKNISIASSLAQEKMEEALSKDYDEIISLTRQKESEDPNDPYYLYETQVDVVYVDPNNDLNESTTDQDIKKMTISVFWEESGQEKNVIVNSLFSKK